jgi:hypothetical protein
MHHRHLLRRGPRGDSAPPAVVAHPASGKLRSRIVVDIVDHRRIHVVHAAVIIQHAVIPIRAIIAASGIAETIIDSTVKSDVRTPITAMPPIVAAIVVPIGWRPQRIHPRRHHPCARNPVITTICPTPISGRPIIVVAGIRRLAVIRKRRRRIVRLDWRLASRVVVVIICRIILRCRQIRRSVAVIRWARGLPIIRRIILRHLLPGRLARRLV